MMKSVMKKKENNTMKPESVPETIIWSVLLYGCKCFTINKELERRLEATETWFLRKVMNVSCTEKKTNEEVLRKARVKSSLIKTMRKRKMSFVRYI